MATRTPSPPITTGVLPHGPLPMTETLRSQVSESYRDVPYPSRRKTELARPNGMFSSSEPEKNRALQGHLTQGYLQ